MKLEVPNTVAEVMTRDVITVEEDDSLANLRESLRTLRFRHLPVTDEDRLVGLVTETDLLGIASSNLLPHHAAQDRDLEERFRVRDIMARDVVTVRPDTPLQEAARLLLKQRFHCLPVVDEHNVLRGVVTSSDFTKLIALARRTRSSPASGEPRQLP
jgi:CBS domain-containing membrane protein